MPVLFAVSAKQPLASHTPVLVAIADPLQVVAFALGIAVRINKMVVTGVVGRVYVNHLDRAEVGLLQNFQHRQIFTLNKNVIGFIKVDRFFPARRQRCRGRRLECAERAGLARPVEMIALVLKCALPAQGDAQLFPVNGSLGKRLGNNFPQPRQSFFRDVERCPIHSACLLHRTPAPRPYPPARISLMSPGVRDTAQAQRPKPP